MESRRQFLKKISLVLAAVPLAVLTPGKLFSQEKKKKKEDSASNTPSLASPNDPTAKALGYVEKSPQPAKSCGNCILYQACGKPTGGCSVLPGKLVKKEAYCNSWTNSPTCKA